MTSKINGSVRSNETVQTVVAIEEQQLLGALQARAPKKQGWSISLPAIFMIF